MKDYTDVAAALIWREGKFLICRRPAHKTNALLWEFVGGKAEAGETLPETLIRECREELAITVEPHDVFMQVTHTYPDIKVLLTLFNATIREGEPQLLEHAELRWISTEEIPQFEFCPADKDILLEIQRRAGALQMEGRNKMKLGVSIIPRMMNPHTAKPFELQQIDEYGGLDAMLASWKKQGVSHIEFRCIHPEDDAAYALACAERVWAAGLQVTVHGTLPSAVGRFETVYPSLLPLLSAAKKHQPWVNITVHAYDSDEDSDLAKLSAKTKEILTLWAEDAQSLGFRLALENNRSKGGYDPGNHCDGVLAMLPASEQVGVCFDFGHHYYNMSINDGTPDLLPPSEFLQRAFHTHIHALCNQKTHAPFVGDAAMPLARYLAALKSASYTGVYNLELSVNGFNVASYREAIDTSIRVLHEALCAEEC